eukprot:TRINITY_DN114150_c0_g1_i1.p1 TRINITY_DN114150_c0_g1~~TRINITY_DN114150_c0_g1_i1.p1  ORF type:complete len:272 (-),score=52.79 TRINITY_DN114150_c0_g1_i1:189-1004(-)
MAGSSTRLMWLLASWTLLLRLHVDAVSLRAVAAGQGQQAPAETTATTTLVTPPGDPGAASSAFGVEAATQGTCNCDMCEGRRVLAAGIGSWNCALRGNLTQPSASSLDGPQDAPTCQQEGTQKDWVVQRPVVAYDRFCHMTCKPDVPEALIPAVNCIHLTTDVIKAYAQTPDGNGKAFVWKSIPMADSLTLSEIPAKPGVLVYSPQADPTGGALRGIFGKSARRRRALNKVEPGCHCRCGLHNLTNLTDPAVGDVEQMPSLLQRASTGCCC